MVKTQVYTGQNSGGNIPLFAGSSNVAFQAAQANRPLDLSPITDAVQRTTDQITGIQAAQCAKARAQADDLERITTIKDAQIGITQKLAEFDANYTATNPQGRGWAKARQEFVQSELQKMPINNPRIAPAVQGAFGSLELNAFSDGLSMETKQANKYNDDLWNKNLQQSADMVVPGDANGFYNLAGQLQEVGSKLQRDPDMVAKNVSNLASTYFQKSVGEIENRLFKNEISAQDAMKATEELLTTANSKEFTSIMNFDNSEKVSTRLRSFREGVKNDIDKQQAKMLQVMGQKADVDGNNLLSEVEQMGLGDNQAARLNEIVSIYEAKGDYEKAHNIKAQIESKSVVHGFKKATDGMESPQELLAYAEKWKPQAGDPNFAQKQSSYDEIVKYIGNRQEDLSKDFAGTINKYDNSVKMAEQLDINKSQLSGQPVTYTNKVSAMWNKGEKAGIPTSQRTLLGKDESEKLIGEIKASINTPDQLKSYLGELQSAYNVKLPDGTNAYNRVLYELKDAGLDSSMFVVAENINKSWSNDLLNATRQGKQNLEKAIPNFKPSEFNGNLDTQLREYRSSMQAGTGYGRNQLVSRVDAVDTLAKFYMGAGYGMNSKDAVNKAYKQIIGDKYSKINTGGKPQFISKEINGKQIDVGLVESSINKFKGKLNDPDYLDMQRGGGLSIRPLNGGSKEYRAQFEPVARQAAKDSGIPEQLLLNLITQESGWNPQARSGVGAGGIAQIMPGTAKSWNVNPSDPVASIKAAAKALGGYYKTYKSQGNSDQDALKLTLAAYNAGPGNVAKYGKNIYSGKTGISDFDGQTTNYVKNILGTPTQQVSSSLLSKNRKEVIINDSGTRAEVYYYNQSGGLVPLRNNKGDVVGLDLGNYTTSQAMYNKFSAPLNAIGLDVIKPIRDAVGIPSSNSPEAQQASRSKQEDTKLKAQKQDRANKENKAFKGTSVYIPGGAFGGTTVQ